MTLSDKKSLGRSDDVTLAFRVGALAIYIHFLSALMGSTKQDSGIVYEGIYHNLHSLTCLVGL